MNALERKILDNHFPSVNAGANKRYSKDDIFNVLNFMKDNPNVQIGTIAEYAKISLGTLVSWRKKYGDYLGIKTKQYSNSEINDKALANQSKDIFTINAAEGKNVARISHSMIQELRKVYESGSKAEMTLDQRLFKVDDQYLYVFDQRV